MLRVLKALFPSSTVSDWQKVLRVYCMFWGYLQKLKKWVSFRNSRVRALVSFQLYWPVVAQFFTNILLYLRTTCRQISLNLNVVTSCFLVYSFLSRSRCSNFPPCSYRGSILNWYVVKYCSAFNMLGNLQNSFSMWKSSCFFAYQASSNPLCGSTPGCVFPFTYNGNTYNTCAYANGNTPWCSSQVDGFGRHIGSKVDCSLDEVLGCPLYHTGMLGKNAWLRGRSWYPYVRILRRGSWWPLWIPIQLPFIKGHDSMPSVARWIQMVRYSCQWDQWLHWRMDILQRTPL